MIIDCDGCQMRGLACSDCVVSVLLGPPVRLDNDQQDAIEALSEAGMVPPLRLVVGQAEAGPPGGVRAGQGAVGRDQAMTRRDTPSKVPRKVC